MANEGKERIAADRGAKASALLQNDLLQEAFTKIEETLLTEWKKTTSEDSQTREDAWRSYKLLQNLKGYLSKIVTDGNTANTLLQIKKPSIFNRN